jgi:predicted metal-dependent HD superfamily phosphohydrolase
MTPRPDIVEPFPDHPGMDVRTMKGSDVAADRFTDLWRRRVASPPSPDGATVYAELCRLYTAPYRRYHNLGHIEDCLRLADEVAPLLVDRDAVEFGLWFHDAVYDTGVTTNEWRSAELFLNVSAGAPFVFRHRVCGHILATRHRGTTRGNDRCFLVDIDLSGFGAPWDEFLRNGALLREESADQPDATYHAGQVIFLSAMQQRPHFYQTEYFRDRYEAIARANLDRLLAELRAMGYGAAARSTL